MIRSAQFDEFAKRYDVAMKAACTAAAYTYAMKVKERLMAGYTSGDFSHGGAGVAGSVTVGAVTRDAVGYGLHVGTNVPYAAFWEFGHMNVFTRQYERVEVWRETFEATADDMVVAFGKAFEAKMRGETATPELQLYGAESPYQGPDPAKPFGGYR